jgi:hypothetical protein
MKNLKISFRAIALSSFCILCLTACQKEEKDPDILLVLPTDLTFSATDTREQTISVSTNAPSWKFSGGDSWLDSYIKQDNKLYIKVENYTNTETSRKSTLTITAGDAQPVTISIEQTPMEINTLSVSPESLSFDGDETGEKTVTVTTNAPDWTPATEADWLTLSKEDKTLKIAVPTENTGTADRTANIRITAGNAPELILKVTQTVSFHLNVEPATISFEANETGEKTATISTNATSWNATTDATWLTLTPGDNSLHIKVNSKNTDTSPRLADIRITAGDAPEVILKVTQAEATYLNIEPTSISFEANETDEKTATVSTNATSWNATTDATWLTLTPDDNNLRIKVNSTNTTTSPRQANVRVTAGDAPEVTLNVTQEGESIYLNISPTSLTFEANETSEKTVTVSTNATSWDATTTATWLTVTKSGNNLHIGISSTNTSASSRQADIRIITDDASSEAILYITQTGMSAYLSVSSTSLTYTATETGEKSITVSTNTTSWNATTSATWLTATQSGNILHIRVNSANTNTSSRQAIVNVTAANVPDVTIRVTQAAAVSIPPFGEIAKGNYRATGTCLYDFAGSNYNNWSGTITPVNATNPYYAVSNWGNKPLTLYCNYRNGVIMLDNTTQVYSDSEYYGIFNMATYNSNTRMLTYYPNVNYIIKYDSSSRVLDFSGTYNGLPIYIGVAIYQKSDKKYNGNLLLNNVHLGPKLTLTSPTYSAPASDSDEKGILRLGEETSKASKAVLPKDPNAYRTTIDYRKETVGLP